MELATISGGTDRGGMMSGFSKPRLDRLHDVMAGYVERGVLPGLVTAVSRDGELHVDALGVQTLGEPTPMAPDTLFRISSMTKPVTAVAAMILVEECAIRLDEPIGRLLPELANPQVLRSIDGPVDDVEPARRPITVRDLLTFTSGWGQPFVPPGTYPFQDRAREVRGYDGPPRPELLRPADDWIADLGTLPLMFHPGEQWAYDTGSDILGVLIERASGRPFEQFLAERIFGPLGMTDTAFWVPEAKLGRLATSYAPRPGTAELAVFDPAAGGGWSRPPAMAQGSAGLVSTVSDYLSFGQMLLDGGIGAGERILSRPAVELMTSDQLTAGQKSRTDWIEGHFDRWGWGFGMAVRTRRTNLESVGRFGWDGGMGSNWYADPREGLNGIMMTQVCWTSPAAPDQVQDFWTTLYQSLDD